MNGNLVRKTHRIVNAMYNPRLTKTIKITEAVEMRENAFAANCWDG
jgi:hypothetical protein